MASFWKDNPCSPTWQGFLDSWMHGYPSKLVEPRPPNQKISLPPGLSLRYATPSDLEQLPEFWTRYFSSATRCIVPLLHIQKMVSVNLWNIIVISDAHGFIVGSLVRRWIKKVHMKEVLWQKLGIIEYFCIHPRYRKRGIGRALLSCIHNVTERPIPPHLMLLEGIQVRIPPICAGVYVSKRCQGNLQGILVKEDLPSIWKKCVKGGIWSEYTESFETTIWKMPSGYIAIWNTFHYAIPDGARIGIIVGYSVQKAVEEATQTTTHGYGVVLMPTLNLEWTLDSPFQWLAYNMTAGFIGGFPSICF
jgi:GNAT superfamily N-acetyltransferase